MNKVYKDWKYYDKIDIDRREYHISFIRRREDWYDLIRYDSHEIRKGVLILSPYYHIKLKGSYKEQEKVLNNLKKIIDGVLPNLAQIIENEK